jgi:hypothetical protein
MAGIGENGHSARLGVRLPPESGHSGKIGLNNRY